MNILGVGGYAHDSSAALLVDGGIVAAVEEERISRVKHTGGWPTRAIDFCLRRAGLQPSQIDYIAYPSKLFGPNTWKRAAYHLRNTASNPRYGLAYFAHDMYTQGWVHYLLGQSAPTARKMLVDHHLAHMASSYFNSNFSCATIVSIDSRGDWATTVIGVGEGNKIRKLRTTNWPHSIGQVYCNVTNYLGFRTHDEYKVMGLAAFGQPRYMDQMRKLVQVGGDGTYRLDLSYHTTHRKPGRYEGYVTGAMERLLGPARKAGEPLEQRHMDVAASLQELLEEVILKILAYAKREMGGDNLCLSGGVALNSVMNYRIHTESGYRQIHIHPSPGDAGTSLGAALFTQHHTLGQPRPSQVVDDPFLGPSYDEEDIVATLREAKVSYRRPEDLLGEAAAMLRKKMILGWFQGAVEWGPRALGNRSILADPTFPDMTDLVNARVKHREDFRPFAPSVPVEVGDKYFELPGPSPYMLMVVPTREEAKKLIPAVVHTDGTARVQTVQQEANPTYWRLLHRFGELSGVPVVLNTSFNVMGEPIVNTPTDALRCFFSTGLDALCLGPFIVEK
jgi:carbamoyltransferase